MKVHVRHLHAQLRPELRLIFFSARLSLLVGTALNVINQGERIWNGGQISWPHALLNFAVPFSVSLFSGLRGRRAPQDPSACHRTGCPLHLR